MRRRLGKNTRQKSHAFCPLIERGIYMPTYIEDKLLKFWCQLNMSQYT